MHVVLWIAQLVLASLFAISGGMKISLPIPALSESAPWTADVSPMLVRFIGAVELLGAAGVLLPALTGVKPWLTPLAAAALALVMLLAMGFHLTRGEATAIGINVMLGALALFVAWGRARRAPIAPLR